MKFNISESRSSMFQNNKKILSTAIDISQLLFNNQCTYFETEKVIALIQDELRLQRENIEYDSIDNLRKGNKINCADNEIIRPLKHVNLF